MGTFDRAPEPTLEEISASIRGGPAFPASPDWQRPLPETAGDDLGKSLSDTISSIQKAIRALATQKEPAAVPPQQVARLAPAGERLPDIGAPKKATRAVSRRRAATLTPAIETAAEPNINEYLRPLLRRWIDDNMSQAFEPSLRQAMRETGLPRWKVRQNIKRWRRQSKSASDARF